MLSATSFSHISTPRVIPKPRFGLQGFTTQDFDNLTQGLREGTVAVLKVDCQNDVMLHQPQQRQVGRAMLNAESLIPNLEAIHKAVKTFNRRILAATRPLLKPIPRLATQATHHTDSWAPSDHCVKDTDGWGFVNELNDRKKSDRALVFDISPKTACEGQPDYLSQPQRIPHKRRKAIKSQINTALKKGRPIVVEKDGHSILRGNPEGKVIYQALKAAGVTTVVNVGGATDDCHQTTIADQKTVGLSPVIISDAMRRTLNTALHKPGHPVYGDVKELNTRMFLQKLTEAGTADVVLGLSGDPLQNGHVRLTQIAEKQLKEKHGFSNVATTVIPAYAQPQKQGRFNVATFNQRLDMCQRGFAPYPNVNVSDIEKYLPKPSYTSQTLRAFFPDLDTTRRQRFFIMGADTLKGLPTWEDPTLFTKRHGKPAKMTILAAKRNRMPIRRKATIKGKKREFDVIPLDEQIQTVASSTVKQRWVDGKGIEHLVPESTLAYMDQHQLYL